MFKHIGDLNLFLKIRWKTLVLESILIRLHASDIQSATFIRKMAIPQRFSCEFRKKKLRIDFLEQLRVTAFVTLTLLKYNFLFIMHFSLCYAQILYSRKAPAK